MPSSIADVRPTTPDVPAGQDILGGTCPLAPIQVCILWTARQEKVISPLAFRVYFAAHEVKYWRCKTEPGEPYHDEPYGFQPSDIGRLLPGVPEAKIAKAFNELEATNILTISDTGIWFAERLDDVNITERVKQRARAIFEQLHTDTRDKVVKFPRRLLKLLVQCGRRIVRAATIIGMLLTTMLTKRTKQYDGYKGCCKAEWIGKLFSVNAKRVNLERAKLIAEGWFRRLLTPQRVRQRYGEWIALNLTPSEPPTPVDNTTASAPEVQPLQSDTEPKVQPPFIEPVSPTEIEKNQELPPSNPTGASQLKNFGEPSWNNIILEDLHNDARSEVLRQEVTQQGYLKNSQPDRISFFAAIAHALRVAKTNACGLLHTIVEQGLWQFISQADEYNGIARLRRSTEDRETKHAPLVHENLLLITNTDGVGQVDEQPLTLSEDAVIVQTLTADLEKAGVTGDVFPLVQRHGYLHEWDTERWEQAERAVAQARVLHAQQQYVARDLGAAREVGEGYRYEDDPHCAWGS